MFMNKLLLFSLLLITMLTKAQQVVVDSLYSDLYNDIKQSNYVLKSNAQTNYAEISIIISQYENPSSVITLNIPGVNLNTYDSVSISYVIDAHNFGGGQFINYMQGAAGVLTMSKHAYSSIFNENVNLSSNTNVQIANVTKTEFIDYSMQKIYLNKNAIIDSNKIDLFHLNSGSTFESINTMQGTPVQGCYGIGFMLYSCYCQTTYPGNMTSQNNCVNNFMMSGMITEHFCGVKQINVIGYRTEVTTNITARKTNRKVIEVYDLFGNKVPMDAKKGLYIERYSDGTAYKVFRK